MAERQRKPTRRDDLVQGSEQWHQWRDRHINASDAPIILLADPFQDPFRLWQEKTGRVPRREFKDYYEGGELIEHPVHHGSRLEDVARNWYCRDRGLFTAPVCLEHGETEWMGASLDGWPEPDCILEIKCPRDLRVHLDAREGSIPESHYIQCQHAMCVANVEYCDYLSYCQIEKRTDASICVIRVGYDRDFVEQTLLPAEREFWKWLVADEFPLPQGTVEIDPIADSTWRKMVARYLDARRAREQAERQEATALRELRLRTRGAALTRDGIIEMKWFVRRGWIQWQRIPEVQEVATRLGPHLDDYRGPSTLAFRITRLSESFGGEGHGEKVVRRDGVRPGDRGG